MRESSVVAFHPSSRPMPFRIPLSPNTLRPHPAAAAAAGYESPHSPRELGINRSGTVGLLTTPGPVFFLKKFITLAFDLYRSWLFTRASNTAVMSTWKPAWSSFFF